MAAQLKAVIFDLDGTLLDSYAAITDALNTALGAFALPEVTAEACRRMVGHGLESLLTRTLGPERLPEGLPLFRARYADAGPGLTRLMPWADEVTRELYRRGIPIGIASNKPSFFSRQLLEALGLLDRFAHVVGPDEGFPTKPDPAMVHAILRSLGASAHEVILVGDMTIDVETARNAGLLVAAIPTGSSTREELLAASPDYFFESLEELLPLFP